MADDLCAADLPSLDAVTARLIGCAAEDASALRQIIQHLEAWADRGVDEQAAQSLRVSAAFIEQALTRTTDDPDASLRLAADVLAEAVARLDPCDVEAVRDVRPPAEPAAGPAPVTEVVQDVALLPSDADMVILKDYIAESLDHIEASEAALLELETDPDNIELVNTIFRAFHTIKGTSGFFGLDRNQALAHHAESLLDRARNGQIKLVGGYADLALRSCDMLRLLIEGVQNARPGGPIPLPAGLGDLLGQLSDPAAAGIGEEDCAEPLRVGDILVAQGAADREQVEAAARAPGAGRLGERLVRGHVAPAQEVARALRLQKQSAAASDTSVRVATDRLDSMIDMVGELVIAQSMVADDAAGRETTSPRLARNVAHAGKIIRDLQDLTMSLRMVPLKALFHKMNRLVRDLARKSGKSVQLITEGEDTEIDRNMVESLNDPLLHMIRNSVDHGVEGPDARAGRGKPPTGTIWLRAYHSAGNVVIELQDDGQGLNREKIAAKAVERGLIDPGRELSEAEAFKLIWHPGFSTADTITDVSGRGVGMDVVKRSIESLRGRVEVDSVFGVGTTFTLRLPLTMAITDAMLVRVGRERYLLPTISIEQSLRPRGEDLSSVVGRGEVVMLRGDLLPVFRLHRLFDVPDAQTELTDGLLIVVEGEGRRCAVMVDELLGQQQVVIKSLGASFGDVRGVAGAAILGDGNVGLILDAGSLIKLATARDHAEILEPAGALG
ncbi:MAG: chemotaxis protein CheA [Planctomycetes bacterium]|nr:chemotaxis protein CheA [Planctomycetota bacterium]